MLLGLQENEKVLPIAGEGGKPEDGVPRTVTLYYTHRLGEVNVVPVVAQSYLSLLAVTSGATQKFSANVDKAILTQCVLPFRLGQFERSSSGAENSLTLQ